MQKRAHLRFGLQLLGEFVWRDSNYSIIQKYVYSSSVNKGPTVSAGEVCNLALALVYK